MNFDDYIQQLLGNTNPQGNMFTGLSSMPPSNNIPAVNNNNPFSVQNAIDARNASNVVAAPAPPPQEAIPTSSGMLNANSGSSSSDNPSGIATAEATPYGGLFGGLPGLAVSAINMGMPGFGRMYGAASGYGGQVSANNLGTAMDAWGGESNVSGSPTLSALGGLFGYTPQGLENAKAFAGNFSSEANMNGYMEAAQSSTPMGALTSAISANQLGQSNAQMTADEYGALATNTMNAVNESVASGKSLFKAMTDVGVAQGIPTTAIAAIAANFNTQDPLGQLAANLDVAPDPQAAVNAQANAMPVDPGIQAAIRANEAAASLQAEREANQAAQAAAQAQAEAQAEAQAQAQAQAEAQARAAAQTQAEAQARAASQARAAAAAAAAQAAAQAAARDSRGAGGDRNSSNAGAGGSGSVGSGGGNAGGGYSSGGW